MWFSVCVSVDTTTVVADLECGSIGNGLNLVFKAVLGFSGGSSVARLLGPH